MAVAYTYAAPLISRLTGRVVLEGAAEAVGERVAVTAVGEAAAAMIGLRILGMALGGWITLGAFVIQVIIWEITPDALQDGIDHCTFGKKRRTGGYKTSKEQEQKFEHALVEMGFQ